ncbi:L-threonylcarbamoyladenylate synthase [Aureococcus anophagefferens]|nr:L-threonylcarbamoyladenylate synthase [Aureococcus anophagefferens]
MDYLDVLADGSDAWRLDDDIIGTLNRGGVGVIPTDTSYSFVARVDSKAAVQRLLALKGDENRKKPLSLLCADLGTIDEYTRYTSKRTFKLLKAALPGPYTMILPASEALPRMIYKGGARRWKRDTVGVRIPDDPVCAHILSQVDGPSSARPCRRRTTATSSSAACPSRATRRPGALVDFVVDAGARPIEGSTVYDRLRRRARDPPRGLAARALH